MIEGIVEIYTKDKDLYLYNIVESDVEIIGRFNLKIVNPIYKANPEEIPIIKINEIKIDISDLLKFYNLKTLNCIQKIIDKIILTNVCFSFPIEYEENLNIKNLIFENNCAILILNG